MSSNPYTTPDANLEAGLQQGVSREYGGINRVAYFGLSILAGIVNSALSGVALTSPSLFMILTVAGIVVMFVLTSQRLKNIGDNGWLCLLMIVPIVNFVLWVRCQAYQEGYHEAGSLDTAGKVIVSICVGLLLIVMAAILLAVYIP